MTIKVTSNNLILLNNLNRTGDRLATAMGRLSTGYRINSASDGAAELMLSKGLEKQISGLSVCNDNASMARNVLSVADGSLSQVTAMAQRIRDIALSSANGVYGEAERQAYQSEVDGLVEEIKRQVNDAKYNDYHLFFGAISPEIETSEERIGTSGTVGVRSVQKVSQEEARAQGYTCVSTAQELKDVLVTGDTNCKVMLMADINLDDLGLDATGSNWTAIGYTDNFEGTLDGNGYTIQNLKINSATNHQGLFGWIGESGTVKNLNISNASVTSTMDCVGVIVGSNMGTIENCSVTNATVKSGSERVGGLAGQSIGTISNCKVEGNIEGVNMTGGLTGINFGDITSSYASGNVKGNGTYTGGFAGINNTTITNCYSKTKVTGLGDATAGFVGMTQGGTIEGCYSTGEVEGSGDFTGGFAAVSANSSIISKSYSTGVVAGHGQAVGGFIGLAQNAASLTSNYASGKVSNDGAYNTGGFAGAAIGSSSINSCWATGDVSAVNMNSGGFVGDIDSNATVTSCWATGNVNGSTQVGGFVGSNYGTSTVSHCYATGNAKGTGNFVGGFTGVSTDGSSFDSCYATGDIEGVNYAGGFAGAVQNGKIENSYSTGSVTGSAGLGDFVGQVFSSITISNYAFAAKPDGSVISASGVGNIAGTISGNPVKEAKWFEDKNNLTSIIGSDWNFSYLNSKLTFQIGTETGSTSTLDIDLNFGVDNFNVDVTTGDSSRASLSAIDELIEYTTKMQGKIGSAINVVDSVLGNNTQTQINLTDSNGRLIDADIAEESAEFVKNQIRQNLTASLLVQTGTNMSEVLLALYGL